MVISKIVARRGDYEPNFRQIEAVVLTWDEMRKRRMRVQTDGGRWMDLAFDEGGALCDGDLLYVEGDLGIILRMAPEEVLAIYPRTPRELGLICYELGNRHLPSWLSPDEILVIDDPVLKEFLRQHGIQFESQIRTVSAPHLTAVGGGVSHSHSH